MNPSRRAALFSASVVVAVALAGCGGSGGSAGGGDATSSGINVGGGTRSADAKACREFKGLPDDAGDSETAKVIAKARSRELVDSLKELEALPDDLGFEDLGKVAIIYEKIRAACAEADVKLPSFSDLMESGDDSGGSDSSELPACPETAGQRIAYADIVKMNADGCVDSTGGQSLVVYGGRCSDGRQFAYKNLTDIKEDPDGMDDRAYVVAAPGGTGTVIVDKDNQSDAMTKLEMNCG